MASVIVVDDDQYLREVLSFMLERLGHTVTAAGSPTEALTVFESQRFDAAILDWSMPGMTGGELCEQIRRDPAVADTPIMILTAYADQQTRDHALAAGADQFMTKPLTLAELSSSVEALVNLRG
ncbi:Response regulator receiver domain-containing protein [Nocardioides exalbidus]|uniref:Response regulator receiver domain-containing protein n=1 Tax=Nocardioides exalbidus TaxID=402596 RepID=A0A1H4R8D9_9ACTN|nr:response regulator [Nocardioides exalbidus]SEC28096.1 Response regulator receiver domain-containing protein [Nocardioides exalbidus]